ncbi:hypothetical protein U14_05863 [Candidatus Moduliflexus flocculans]|uniref:AB hydrolase-1 domain-containing protein n=1 Tax=Candidatus Moduliflexus flocculans TaxID=1499966 RepID=A0A081BT45_9BACT|nr:hypothetical protein U14_05863 [Candidatus Moduliflexus flocculans]
MPRITVNHISIHYQERGDIANPTIVMVHGLGCSLKYWDCVFDAPVFSSYRLISLDLPGFGGSEKPNSYDYRFETQAAMIFDVLDALRARDVILVGHSMGGAIAILMALQRPEALRQLIVVEPNLRAGDAQLSKRIVSYANETNFIARYEEFRDLAITLVTGWFVRFHQADLDEYIDELLQATPISMYRSARSLISVTTDPQFIQQFRQLPLNKHFLIGEETLKQRPALKELLGQNVDTVIVPGVGHMMMVDDPTIFTQTLAHILLKDRLQETLHGGRNDSFD